MIIHSFVEVQDNLDFYIICWAFPNYVVVYTIE